MPRKLDPLELRAALKIAHRELAKERRQAKNIAHIQAEHNRTLLTLKQYHDGMRDTVSQAVAGLERARKARGVFLTRDEITSLLTDVGETLEHGPTWRAVLKLTRELDALDVMDETATIAEDLAKPPKRVTN